MKTFNWAKYCYDHEIIIFLDLPKGWSFIPDANHCPKLFMWAHNNKDIFSAEREYGLVYIGEDPEVYDAFCEAICNEIVNQRNSYANK